MGIRAIQALHDAIVALPCEFSCFFGASTTEFYVDLAIYYVSIIVVEMI